jgi:hypothetical protein
MPRERTGGREGGEDGLVLEKEESAIDAVDVSSAD